ncbi:hypothetical protein MC7420_8256 [Coleofasciculus chthonoplastes PCC 7420]|uniref:Uncharacterized protein n=1 Tax=Coleofasciculus chthonoplastes PCC 7420 TaxID=118168 RepID=B4W0R9_9CYAN|nr:hypothetical protein MC7420_8256 [Coleofasciculus chthonoplastes PCC 7420]
MSEITRGRIQALPKPFYLQLNVSRIYSLELFSQLSLTRQNFQVRISS